MRILIGWDKSAEAETIGLLLNVGDNLALVTTHPGEFESAAQTESWDVIVQAMNFPCEEESFRLFQRMRDLHPNIPIVGACRQTEIVRLARFISNGLHSYVFRDPNGDFIFLLTTLLESAHATLLAQRARQLAEILREEIDSVRRLQESVIPRDLPAPNEYQVAARYEPSQIRVLGSRPVVMAGGDYYDVFNIDNERLVLIVGDASGHGVKACMSIMTMHTLIRMVRGNRYGSTGGFVTEVNERLCESEVVQDQGGFITLLYSVLDVGSHTLEWTSAGHPMPLLQDLRTNEVRVLGDEDNAGLPLAIDKDALYAPCTVTIPRHSRLVIYTDGLAEAFAPGAKTDQFGLSGMIGALQATAELPPQDALERLFSASSAFTQGTGRADDTSVVIVQRN
jgi:serine phosphatase RsbU (regulator of sigma subunit)